MIEHITVTTSKFKETVQFYDWLLGIKIARQIETPAGTIAFLGDGETKLELIESKDCELLNEKNISIGFEVESLDSKIAMLNEKSIKVSGVISPSPAIKFAFTKDPSGLTVQLCESLKH